MTTLSAASMKKKKSISTSTGKVCDRLNSTPE